MEPCYLRQIALLGVIFCSACPRPTAAAPPPIPWVAADIGDTGAVGACDATDAPAVFSVRGSGTGIFTNEDSFHYCYQVVRGDASLTARFLRSDSDSDTPPRAGFGLMIRESASPNAANLYFAVTPDPNRRGLSATVRVQRGRETEDNFGSVSPPGVFGVGLYLRLQRVGGEITGYYSQDGALWRQAAFPAQTLPTLQADALIGLGVTAHRYGEIVTGIFDQVAIQPGEVSVSNMVGAGADRSALLEWRAATGSALYNLYRGPVGSSRDQMARLNSVPIAGTFFMDRSAGLENGVAVTYAVAPVFPGPGGTPREGPAVAIEVMPVAVPRGWFGCELGPQPGQGSTVFDLNARQITLRGSGVHVLGGRASELYMLGQVVEGDIQITAKLRGHELGIAGVMIREELDPVSRQASIYSLRRAPPPGEAARTDVPIFATFQTSVAESIRNLPATSTRANEGIRLPVLLRLTRQGDTIEFEYSVDSGATFLRAIAPVTFNPPLARTLYVGLVVASENRLGPSEARFDIPTIQKP